MNNFAILDLKQRALQQCTSRDFSVYPTDFEEKLAQVVALECANISYNSGESGEDIARDILYKFSINQNDK